MTSTAGRFAAVAAIGSSLICLFSIMTFFPALLSKISDIQNQVELDMNEFNVLAGEAWKEIRIMSMKSKSKASMYHHDGTARSKRQAPECQCNSQNSCPPGSPGAPGELGMDGESGIPGKRGDPGLPGTTPPVEVTSDGQCRVCPNGNRGPPGPNGQPGPAGSKGRPGEGGRPGRPGGRGSGGPPGPPGDGGKDGSPGENGLVGRPGTSGGKGESGQPGKAGERGRKGQPGRLGRNGNPGSPGPGGPPGPVGKPGSEGFPGQDSVPGQTGPPGEDAQYCPCPGRDAAVNSNRPEVQNQGYGDWNKRNLH